MSTGTGGINRSGSTPISTTTDTGVTHQDKEQETKGNIPGRGTVEKENPNTPIKNAAQKSDGELDTPIDTRDIRASVSDEPYYDDPDFEGEVDVFFDSYEELPSEPGDKVVTDEQWDSLYSELGIEPSPETTSTALSLTDEDIRALEQVAQEDTAQHTEEQSLVLVESQISRSSVLHRFKEARKRIAKGIKKFIDRFRPDKTVAMKMSKGCVELVDVMAGETDRSESSVEAVAEQIATDLQNKPEDLLKKMEAHGLSQVIGEIRDSIKVANKKNLHKIKDMLMSESAKYPALQGMSREAREIMVNSVLMAAKIGNPGKDLQSGIKGVDVTRLTSRGYVVGKVPSAKLAQVRALLSVDSDSAMKQLAIMLPGSNFREVMRQELAYDYISDMQDQDGNNWMFGSNEPEVASEPSLVKVDAERTEESQQQRARFKDTQQKVRAERQQRRAESHSGQQAVLSEDNITALFDEEKAVKDAYDAKMELFKQDYPEFSKVLEEIPGAADEMDAKRAESERLQKEKKQTEFMAAEWEAARAEHLKATQKIEEEGGLTSNVETSLKQLQVSLVRDMEANGMTEGEAELCARGIMVACKLATLVNESSCDEIALLGAAALGSGYTKAISDASGLAGKGKEEILSKLNGDPLLKVARFAQEFENANFFDSDDMGSKFQGSE